MLLGVYEHAMDDKGRVSLPAKHRDELGDAVILAPGLDHQIVVYPVEVWRNLAQGVSAQNQARKAVRELTRYLFHVAECQVDRQGRILIPPSLRGHAQLDTNVVIQGINNRLEIWNAEAWQSMWGRLSAEGSEIAEMLAELGLQL